MNAPRRAAAPIPDTDGRYDLRAVVLLLRPCSKHPVFARHN